MTTIAIIGTGLAGYNLAKEIRKHDTEVSLILVTADGGESYSKPMLSNALAKNKSPEQLVLSSAEKMAGQLNARIYSRTRVVSIDPEKKLLVTDSGEISYEKLVFAVGASQRKLPTSGNAADFIQSVNDLDDYSQFREKLDVAKSILIIGGGLIGCEFANDILTTGKNITVVGSASTPLDRLLPAELGEQLKAELEKQGVHWRLGVTVTEVSTGESMDEAFRVLLSDGSELATDLVFSATGLIPNIELAREAGIKVNRGIVVDRYLQTSVEGIYALGDCVEINGLVLPYVLPLMNSARTLAKTLVGQVTELVYPAMPVVVKTPAYPIVVSPPANPNDGTWQINIDSSGATALFVDNSNQLKGFVLTGEQLSQKQKLTKQLPPVLA